MPFVVKDKVIDKKLDELKQTLQREFNITNCSKTDTLRFLLKIKKQGKKTSKRWKKII